MTNGKVLSGGALTADERAQASADLSYADVELTTVREAAAKWQTGLAATAGAIAAYVGLRGSDDIATLKAPWAAIVGISIALAFSMVLLGGLLAMRAAFGLPKLRSTVSESRFHSNHRSAVQAARLLRLAMVLTVVAVPLSFAAVATTWFAPSGTSPKTRIIVKGSEPICGKVLRVSGGIAFVDTEDGERQADITAIEALSAVEAC